MRERSFYSHYSWNIQKWSIICAVKFGEKKSWYAKASSIQFFDITLVYIKAKWSENIWLFTGFKIKWKQGVKAEWNNKLEYEVFENVRWQGIWITVRLESNNFWDIPKHLRNLPDKVEQVKHKTKTVRQKNTKLNDIKQFLHF